MPSAGQGAGVLERLVGCHAHHAGHRADRLATPRGRAGRTAARPAGAGGSGSRGRTRACVSVRRVRRSAMAAEAAVRADRPGRAGRSSARIIGSSGCGRDQDRAVVGPAGWRVARHAQRRGGEGGERAGLGRRARPGRWLKPASRRRRGGRRLADATTGVRSSRSRRGRRHREREQAADGGAAGEHEDVERPVVQCRGEQRPGGLGCLDRRRRRPPRVTPAPRAAERRRRRPASAMSACGTRTRLAGSIGQLRGEASRASRLGRDEDRRSRPRARTTAVACSDGGPAVRGRVDAGRARPPSSMARAALALVDHDPVSGAPSRGPPRRGAPPGAPAGSRWPARGRRPRRPRRGRRGAVRPGPSAARRAPGAAAAALRSGGQSRREGPVGRRSRSVPRTHTTGDTVKVAPGGGHPRRARRPRPAPGDRPSRARSPRSATGSRRPSRSAAPARPRRPSGSPDRRGARRPRSPRGRRRAPGAPASPARARGRRRSDGRMSSMRSARPRRVSPATASTSASLSPRSSFASRVSTLPWSGCICEVRAQRPQERDPARAVGAHARPDRERGERGPAHAADQRVARVLAGRVGRDHEAWVLVRRDVLGASGRRGPRSRRAAPPRCAPTKAPSPQAVSTGRSSPSVRMIASSVADVVLGEPGGDPVGLDERERAAAGADAEVTGHWDAPAVRARTGSGRPARGRRPRPRRSVTSGAWSRPATSRWLICSTSSRSWSGRSMRRNRRSSSSSAACSRRGRSGPGSRGRWSGPGPTPAKAASASSRTRSKRRRRRCAAARPAGCGRGRRPTCSGRRARPRSSASSAGGDERSTTGMRPGQQVRAGVRRERPAGGDREHDGVDLRQRRLGPEGGELAVRVEGEGRGAIAARGSRRGRARPAVTPRARRGGPSARRRRRAPAGRAAGP